MYFCNSGTGYENKMMKYVSTGNSHKGKKKNSGFCTSFNAGNKNMLILYSNVKRQNYN